MEYTAKTEGGKTIVSVVTDKPLTHCVIDAPGASVEEVHHIQQHANHWLNTGGCLVIGGGDPDRDNVRVSFPGHTIIEESWNVYSYRIEATSVEEAIELRAKAFPPVVITHPEKFHERDVWTAASNGPDAIIQG